MKIGGRQFLQRHHLNATLTRQMVVAGCLAFVACICLRVEAPFGAFDAVSFVRGILIYICVSLAFHIATRRLVTAFVFALGLMGWLASISMTKYAYTLQTLHFFDLFIYFQSTVEAQFFLIHYPWLAFGFVASTACLVGALLWLMRNEQPIKQAMRDRAVVVLIGLAAIGGLAVIENGSDVRREKLYQTSYDFYHFSTFFTSIPDAVVLLRSGDVVGRLLRERSGAPRAGREPAREPPPNIIVILHESAVDPSLYRDGKLYQVPVGFFQSADDRHRQLLVETWGGVTWLSDYGFNFGLSTHMLGSVRSYIGLLTIGQRHHSIARTLAGMGYGTVSVYPSPRVFAQSEKVYKSMGYERVIDQHDLAAAWRERDRVYYNGVVNDLGARRAAGDIRPAYYFVATMATHAPYTDRAFVEDRADEIVPGDAWAEYARRLRLSADDLKEFTEKLTTAFPNERFVVAGFGDHQPTLTKKPDVGVPQNVGSEASMADDPRPFETFYRIRGIRYTPDLSTARSPLEIGLLSTVVLQAARLQLDAGHDLRASLADACNGLMQRCKTPGVRDEFVRVLRQGSPSP